MDDNAINGSCLCGAVNLQGSCRHSPLSDIAIASLPQSLLQRTRSEPVRPSINSSGWMVKTPFSGYDVAGGQAVFGVVLRQVRVPYPAYHQD